MFGKHKATAKFHERKMHDGKLTNPAKGYGHGPLHLATKQRKV